MRWRPAAPIGLLHITTQDLQIEVDGKHYLIPKGATLLGNVRRFSCFAIFRLC